MKSRDFSQNFQKRVRDTFPFSPKDFISCEEFSKIKITIEIPSQEVKFQQKIRWRAKREREDKMIITELLKRNFEPQAIVGGVDLDTATPNYTMITADIPRVGMKLRGSKCQILQRGDGSTFISKGEAWQTSTVQQVKLMDISDDKALAHYRVATRNSVIQVIVNL